MVCRKFAYRNPQTLQSVIAQVTYELTRRQQYGGNRYIYAPHLAQLGEELKEAFTTNAEVLRDDVATFALKMSDVMRAKDTEKGAVESNSHLTLHDYLHRMEAQYKKFAEFPPPSGDELRRVLIHIANFAMLAESKLGNEKT